MRISQISSQVVLLLAVGAPVDRCLSQSIPVAVQQMQLSGFSAITPISTALGQGKNLTVTAGADIAFVGLRRIRSVVEVRGTYPIAAGNVDKQKSFVAGPVIEYSVGRFRPYADFLTGKGAISYLGGGYVFGSKKYISSSTVVYSPGGGLDYSVTHHFAVKADFQYQHWDVPVVVSGHINPTVVSVGGKYMFDFNPHHNRSR
jgi:opacity protein-like surface antigen